MRIEKLSPQLEAEHLPSYRRFQRRTSRLAARKASSAARLRLQLDGHLVAALAGPGLRTMHDTERGIIEIVPEMVIGPKASPIPIGL